jgi:hypothetical protein
MVFNATFNNSSATQWQFVLLVEEIRQNMSKVFDKLYHIMMYPLSSTPHYERDSNLQHYWL